LKLWPSAGVRLAVPLALIALVGAAVALDVSRGEKARAAAPQVSEAGIHKIRHVIVIMQENRSFDSYFGTYPGADGFPMRDGVPADCVPDPLRGACVRPYHDAADVNHGGPHGSANARVDVDHGRMDGFVAQAEHARRVCHGFVDPHCSMAAVRTDVMGYHDAREIPNYWAYARSYVLQDHMFEPDASWSLPAHLFMVSEWSARCSRHGDPFSCRNAIENPGTPPGEVPSFARNVTTPPDYAWTDLTYLLHQHRVSWRYYVFKGSEPDCEDDAATCPAVQQDARTPGIWNPLPWFDTVRRDHQLGNVTSLDNYYRAARTGTLPAVSWIEPTGASASTRRRA
jgi:phospholipase C